MIRIENVTILKVMTFFVIGNYSVMFLLQKNAPRGCDQMHEEYVCLSRHIPHASGAQSVASPSKIEGFRGFEADLSALFMEKCLVFIKLQILSAAAVQE